MKNTFVSLNETILKNKAIQLLRLTKRISSNKKVSDDEIVSYLDAVIDDYCERLKRESRKIHRRKVEQVTKHQSELEKNRALLDDIDLQIAELKSRLNSTKELYDKYNPIQLGVSKIEGYKTSYSEEDAEDA